LCVYLFLLVLLCQRVDNLRVVVWIEPLYMISFGLVHQLVCNQRIEPNIVKAYRL